jgi:hypothetical protein
MKYTLMLVVVAFVIVSCDKKVKDNEFCLYGTIHQQQPTKFLISILDTNGYKVIDSVRTDKDGDFELRVKADYPAIYKFALAENNFIMLIAQPKDKIKLTANDTAFSSNYEIKNSEASLRLKTLNQRNMEVRKKLKSLSTLLQENASTEEFEHIRQRVKEQYVLLKEDELQFTLKFIDNNVGSLASLVALYRTFDGGWLIFADDTDIYNKVLQGLKKTMPNNPQTKYLQEHIEQNQSLLNHIGDKNGTK